MKDYGTDPQHWQTVTEDRPNWRASLNSGTAIGTERTGLTMSSSMRCVMLAIYQYDGEAAKISTVS